MRIGGGQSTWSGSEPFFMLNNPQWWIFSLGWQVSFFPFPPFSSKKLDLFCSLNGIWLCVQVWGWLEASNLLVQGRVGVTNHEVFTQLSSLDPKICIAGHVSIPCIGRARTGLIIDPSELCPVPKEPLVLGVAATRIVTVITINCWSQIQLVAVVQ